MKYFISSIIAAILVLPFVLHAQNTLPDITVKSMNGRVVVSWLNKYDKPLENIIIQRSYDSLANFKSIGNVLNPQNTENGYPDQNPPYSRMYYRVFIYFENGKYFCGPSFKATPDDNNFKPVDYSDIQEINIDSISEVQNDIPEKETTLTTNNIKNVELKKEIGSKPALNIDSIKVPVIKKPTEYNFPSSRIFSSKTSNIVIQLPDYSIKKYTVKFFDDNNNFLFELKKITDDYLILEKLNFTHSGWFYFEIFDQGGMIEKNKFYIGKDSKSSK